MSSIKRYMEVTTVLGINVYDSSKIFRAIKVTAQNHRTIKLFAHKYVSFRPVEIENKSVKTTKELVIAYVTKNRLSSARNGDYIVRNSDGSFKLIRAAEFERLYQETHIRIADLKENK